MRKCPKCKSTQLIMTERWTDMTITWWPGDNFDDGTKEVGDPYRVDAECAKCGHIWRLRGVIQVSEDLLSPVAQSEEVKSKAAQ